MTKETKAQERERLQEWAASADAAAERCKANDRPHSRGMANFHARMAAACRRELQK